MERDGFVVLVGTFVVFPPKAGCDFSKKAVILNKERYYPLQWTESTSVYSSEGLADNPDS